MGYKKKHINGERGRERKVQNGKRPFSFNQQKHNRAIEANFKKEMLDAFLMGEGISEIMKVFK